MAHTSKLIHFVKEGPVQAMPERPADLPDFENPPLIEVVLGVQFAPIKGFDIFALGRLRERFKSQYPNTETHPALDPVIERFKKKGVPSSRASFEFLTSLPMPRCWFLDETRNELIQVQADRLLLNWKRVQQGDSYPRFERLLDRFKANLATFRDFARSDLKVDDLAYNQCEVTYINHIEMIEDLKGHGDINQILVGWTGQGSDGFLNKPEEVSLQLRYLISKPNATAPIGRLRIEARPAYRVRDEVPIIDMRLTARGISGQGIEGVEDFLRTGREWIVRGFTSATQPAMHKKWGRKQ